MAQFEGFERLPIPYLSRWCDLFLENQNVGLIGFRGSIKSTFVRGCVAYRMKFHQKGAYDVVYVSHTHRGAAKRIGRLKKWIEQKHKDWLWNDTTTAESFMAYEKEGAMFNCEPFGIGAAARGDRVDWIIIDDPLDPEKPKSFADIERAKEAISRKWMPLAKDLHVPVTFVSAPIIEGDVVDWIEDNPEFVTDWVPIILPNGESAWPDKYPREAMPGLERKVGRKAWDAEYMLLKVSAIDSFVNPQQFKKQMKIPIDMPEHLIPERFKKQMAQQGR